MAEIIDGKKLADKLLTETAQEVVELTAKGVQPGLVVILVGEDPASQVYVRNKEKDAQKIGIHSKVDRLPESTTEAELLTKIQAYNEDPQFNGILVQLPLPKHIDEKKVLMAIDPEKDVDGFHPLNLGDLFAGAPHMIPCTPYGIMEMFKEYNIELEGKKAVVIGRSNIVGKPMAHLLLGANATVTVTHSRTQDLPSVAREADILVVAIGRGHFVTKEFIKPGAVVIDVGMNRDENGKLIGDVDTKAAAEVASYITPVPGGVGPMTRTMLMKQTVEAAKNQADIS